MRKVRNALLDSRSARQKLAYGKRHWMNLGAGLHLGYWRGATPVGKWLMRRYVGEQRYVLETLAHADDIDDADDVRQELRTDHLIVRVHGEGHLDALEPKRRQRLSTQQLGSTALVLAPNRLRTVA